MNRQSDHTLPEVLVLIGIIARIALPTYQGYSQRSTLSEAFDSLSSFRLRLARRCTTAVSGQLSKRFRWSGDPAGLWLGGLSVSN